MPAFRSFLPSRATVVSGVCIGAGMIFFADALSVFSRLLNAVLDIARMQAAWTLIVLGTIVLYSCFIALDLCIAYGLAYRQRWILSVMPISLAGATLLDGSQSAGLIPPGQMSVPVSSFFLFGILTIFLFANRAHFGDSSMWKKDVVGAFVLLLIVALFLETVLPVTAPFM